MPRKKETLADIVPAEITEKVVEAVQTKRQLTDAQLSKVVRVVNIGNPFEYDLTRYGYGMRWPTRAVYFISTRLFLELLEQGFEGQEA